MKNLAELMISTKQPMLLDPRNQLYIINICLIRYLEDINGKLGDFLVQDPQYSLWERVDKFIHEERPGTI